MSDVILSLQSMWPTELTAFLKLAATDRKSVV